MDDLWQELKECMERYDNSPENKIEVYRLLHMMIEWLDEGGDLPAAEAYVTS